nr:putative integron gene cassette protein [uncultured bacterium]
MRSARNTGQMLASSAPPCSSRTTSKNSPKIIGKSTPAPTDPNLQRYSELLELKSNWGESDIENFDFSLPGDVTDYLLSVRFDDAGEIDEISMES